MLALFPKVPKIQRLKTESIENLQDPLSFDVPSLGNPANIHIKLILQETRVTGLHLRCRQCGSFWKTRVLCNGVRNSHSRPPEVTDFGTNRKSVCNVLLVIDSKLGPHFTLRLSVENSDPIPIPPEFWGVSLGLISDVGAPRSEYPKLINRVITFELTQLIWPQYINFTDRQAAGRTTYCSNTARRTWYIAREVHRTVKKLLH